MTIAIKPTASGSTIEQNGSTILTVDSSGNIVIANDLSVTGTPPTPNALSTASGSAPSYSARAWVNFNGTGTVAIRGSANVTSITDNGSGDYTINFTTAMSDANYSAVLTGRRADETGDTNFGIVFYSDASYLSTSLRIGVGSSNDGTKRDCPTISATIFR